MKKTAKRNLEEMGFVFKDNGDVKDFNGNVYASIVTEQYDLLCSINGNFYYYEDGVYHQYGINTNQISKLTVCRV